MAYKENEETPEQTRSGETKGYIGFQEVTCYLIFYVKIEFSRKYRIGSTREMTEAPLILTYSSVVDRYSVCLALLVSGINDLYIMTCDIVNAYVNAPY